MLPAKAIPIIAKKRTMAAAAAAAGDCVRCLRGCCPVSGCLCSSSSSCCCCPAVLRFLPAFVDALLLVTRNNVLPAVAAAPKLAAAAAPLSLPKASSKQLGRADAVCEAAKPGSTTALRGVAGAAEYSTRQSNTEHATSAYLAPRAAEAAVPAQVADGRAVIH